MQTEDSIKVTIRFFAALKDLVDTGEIRGKATFARMYGIHQPNMRRLEKDPSRNYLPSAWLMYLVRDWGFIAHWLLTGEGKKRSVKP